MSSRQSRRSANKNGNGFIITMRKHINAFREEGLIPDLHPNSKRFVDELRVMRGKN